MNLNKQIAKHFREIYFGGNWTCSNVKEVLSDISWQQAVTKIYNLNTIATLSFHIYYYIGVIAKVLDGGPLEGKDELSFAHPSIENQKNWDDFVLKILNDAEILAKKIDELSEDRIWSVFCEEKYGIYYRHLHGIIEHSHYHLGQIALIKKIVFNNNH